MADKYDSPYVVVTDNLAETVLGYLATPMLISVGSGESYKLYGAWRLRDDEFDATHKPEGIEYRKVRVIRNPDYERWGLK